MLEKYLRAYAVIMNAQKVSLSRPHGRLTSFYYMDAFAGPGTAESKDRAVQEYLKGSPIRAIECRPPFDRLWFVDKNSRRAGQLRQLLGRFDADQRADVFTGNSNPIIRRLAQNLTSTERAFVFLDPYGLQVEWSTVAALATSRRVDVFINFSLMGVTRSLRRKEAPSEDFRAKIHTVMRSDEWLDAMYVAQGSFFGQPLIFRSSIATRDLANRYAADLRTVFGHVSEPILMKNSRGSPLYALIFASQNQRATGIMEEIMVAYRR